MKILRKYCLYALSICMAAVMILLPIRVDAASGNISYLDEIQSVSSGDVLPGDVLPAAAPYSMMKLNEDYGVATAALSYPNALPDVSKSLVYVPSYDTTIDTISIPLHSGNYFDINNNFFSFHTPLIVTSSNSNVQIVNYNLWVKFLGNKYDIGQTTWGQITIDDKNNFSQYIEFGIDIQLSCSESNDVTSDVVIDGQLINGVQSGTYYGSSGQYSGSFYGDVNFLIDDRYIDQIIENRASSSVINVSWTGASYICMYQEKEKTGLLKNIIDGIRNGVIPNIQNYGQGIISNIQSYCLSIITNIQNYGNTILDSLTWNFAELRSHLVTHFENLFLRLDRLIAGYEGTGTTDAANKFDDSAGELTSIEENLSDSSNAFVNDFTTNGFDVSVLTTVGSSMTFIVTWFTNFWNMGGILTSGLNICFAIAIAFFILRVKR